MIIDIILLIAGFALVLKGADFLVNGSSSLAKRMNISEMVIGLTIVSFGTSAPELVVNLIASLKGSNEVVLGNIIGSNIFNTLLILGTAALVRPITIQRKTISWEVPFSVGAALFFYALANDPILFRANAGFVSRLDAALLLILFGIFLGYAWRLSRVTSNLDGGVRLYSAPVSWLLIAVGFAGLFLGGKLVVDNAVAIARDLNVSEKLIALTIVSAGTSLPELATSVVAALKGRSDLAVGNVIGSNIFNLLFILGVSAMAAPVSYQPTFNLDLAVFAVGSLWVIVAALTGEKFKIDRFHGGLLVLLYVAYMVFIIARR